MSIPSDAEFERVLRWFVEMKQKAKPRGGKGTPAQRRLTATRRIQWARRKRVAN